MELLRITQNISYVYLSSKQPGGGHVAVSKLSSYLLVTIYIKFTMLVAKDLCTGDSELT